MRREDAGRLALQELGHPAIGAVPDAWREVVSRVRFAPVPTWLLLEGHPVPGALVRCAAGRFGGAVVRERPGPPWCVKRIPYAPWEPPMNEADMQTGAPRPTGRGALTGIIFVLRSGIPWEMLPLEMGCGSGGTCWRRLRDWQEAGVWDRLHRTLLDRLGDTGRIANASGTLAPVSSAAIIAPPSRAETPGRKRRVSRFSRQHGSGICRQGHRRLPESTIHAGRMVWC